MWSMWIWSDMIRWDHMWQTWRCRFTWWKMWSATRARLQTLLPFVSVFGFSVGVSFGFSVGLIFIWGVIVSGSGLVTFDDSPALSAPGWLTASLFFLSSGSTWAEIIKFRNSDQPCWEQEGLLAVPCLSLGRIMRLRLNSPLIKPHWFYQPWRSGVRDSWKKRISGLIGWLTLGKT